MEAPQDLVEIRQALVAQWGIVAASGPDDWEVLLEALTQRVGHLLLHNPNKLLTALYILDISEKRYLQALDQPTHLDRAHDLARAILERETEKIRTRQRYGKPPDELA